MDTLSPTERSARMALVRNKNTTPERLVRSLVHGLGHSYRLHGGRLPGRPDLVFAKRRKAIFVHGCFWHRHPGCKLARMPKSKLDFWKPKLESNRKRDLRNQKDLEEMGWSVHVIWECELANPQTVARRVEDFLEG